MWRSLHFPSRHLRYPKTLNPYLAIDTANVALTPMPMPGGIFCKHLLDLLFFLFVIMRG